MAKIVGYVKSIKGEYVAKSKDGEVRELHEGDPVYASDLVYNPAKNEQNSIDIDLLATKEDLKLSGKGMVYLEATVTDASVPVEDMTLSQADVNSGLRDVKSDNDAIDDVLKEYGDIDINETAIGKEEVLSGGHGVDQFAKTDGAIADVNSNLKNVSTHSYNLEHDFDPIESSGESGFTPSRVAAVEFSGHQAPPAPDIISPTPVHNSSQPQLSPSPSPSPSTPHQTAIPEISINDVSINEQNGNMIFRVSSNIPAEEDIVFHYRTKDATATSGDDYTGVSGTAVIKSGTTSTTIEVPVKDDSITEVNEKFTIELSDISNNAKIADESGTGIITDDRGSDNPNVDEDTTATLVIDDASTQTEADGNYLVYDVKLSNPVGDDIAVSFNTSGTATAGDDYNQQLQYSTDNGTTWQNITSTVDMPADGSAIKVRVAIKDDANMENDETVILQGSSNDARLTDSSDTGVGIITDDRGSDNPNVDEDTTATLVIDDASTQTEADGNYLVYDVKLSNPVGDDIAVSFNTSGTATAGDDYNQQLQYSTDNGTTWQNITSTVDMPADGSAIKVRVAIKDDANMENDETVILQGSSNDARLTDSSDTGSGTITDDNGNDSIDTIYAKISTDHTTITEDGGDITYTVTLVDKDGNEVTLPDGKSVDVTLSWSGSATADDTTLSSLPTSVIINGNTTHTDIAIPVKDDYFNEGDEPLSATIASVTDINNAYENIAVATEANGYTTDANTATTTIQDGAKENDGGTDDNDTIYAKITGDDTAVEGGYLTHTVTLVDKDGNEVTVPSGKTVTVTLAYTDDSGLDNSDFRENRTTQVQITDGNSSATIQNLTKDDWIGEGNENYTLKITNVSDDDTYFEHVAIANSANGYSSDADSVLGTIQDGVYPGTPDNARVDEDNFDMQYNVTQISDTSSLHITPGGDSNYTLTFENSVTAKDDNGNTITLQSDGKDISYSASGDTLIAKDSDNNTVFEITLDKDTGNYTYTQYKNLDHPEANSDDDITLSFNYNINDTDAKGDTYSTTTSFDVVVNDSMPKAIDQTVSTNEDTSTTIYISDESFKDGQITLNNGVDGDQVVDSGGSIDIYDTEKDDKVGSLLNNGDGTLTFTPNANYSGDTNGFDYQAIDNDNDSETAHVELTVTPVADKPIMPSEITKTTTEDNDNTKEGTNVVNLGLTLPDLADQADQTDQNGTASDDAHERFGLIEFSFLHSNDFGIATLKYDSDDDGTLDATLRTISKHSWLSIKITDVNEYHPEDLGDGKFSLTKAQYESLSVVQAEDNANNIIMDIRTKMYEVDDSGKLLSPDVYSNLVGQRVTVDVGAATDDISLKFDNDQNIGSISKTTNDNDTFTFNTVDEDSSGTLIDLKSLLEKVSGTQNDTNPDLDGSEHRWYTFSGLPEGSIITLGGSKVAVADDGTATIKFPDNTQDDPDFTLQIAPNYGGDIDATLVLHAQDSDIDSDVSPTEKSVTLHLKGTVNAVADDVTVQIKQAVGNEDAGRSAGNTANDSTAESVDQPSNGIPLDIKVSSDDKDGSETYTVTIDKIPDDGSVYIADTDGTYYLYNKDSSTAHNVTITDSDSSDGIYKVTIENYNSDKLPKFIPPHNSDVDYTFDINAYSVDGSSAGATQTLQMDVYVNGIADIPINTDLNSFDRDGKADDNGIYAQVVDENSVIKLEDIYKSYIALNSYDGDGSEILSVVVSDLTPGFRIGGKAFDLGGGRIAKDDMDSMYIIAPSGYAGEASFKLTYVTTEREGDSKTHPTQDVKVLFTPVAEATLSSSTDVVEDTETAIHFTFNAQDSNEALENVYLLKSDVDNKDFTIKLNGNTLADTQTIDSNDYYKVSADDISKLTIQYKSDLGSSDDATITMKYTTTDTLSSANMSDGGGDIVDTSTYQDGTINFSLSPVTDGVSIDVNGASNISGDNIDASDGTNGVEEVTINNTGNFTANVDITALATDNNDADIDGSEKITKLLISNVPDGISIENGVRIFGTTEATWIVDTSELTLDQDEKTYKLTFEVNNGLYDGTGTTKDITIKAFDKDGNSNELSADTKIQLIDNIDNGGNGNGGSPIEASLTINQPSIIEDTEFSLGDFITVNTDPNDGAGDNSHNDITYSVAIDNLEHLNLVDPSSMLSYTDTNGKQVYVISGDESSINSKLASIKVIPDENLNSNNIGNEMLHTHVTLSAYMDGVASIQHTADYNETDITPVTDMLTPVDVNASIDEDYSYTFDINFSSVDNPNYSLNSIVLHRSADIGIVKLSDGTTVNFDSNGNASIPSNKLTGLVFVPTTDISGQVVFDYKANVSEIGASNTLVSANGGSVTIDVNPVVDGLDLSSVSANGIENHFIKVTGIGSSQDTDGSEIVQSVILGDVPDGFLVYHWDSDNNEMVMALNSGDNLSGNTFNLSGTDVYYNDWVVPVDNGNIPDIYINAPGFWSGEVSNMKLKVTNSDGNIETTQTQVFNLDIDPKPNNISANATKTFGNEGEDIPLNLNAKAKDLDGSEKVTLTLEGFGDDKATFKIDGEAVDHNNVSYDSGSDTYTILNINSTHINDVSVIHSSFSDKTINFSIHTVDSATINGSTVTNESNNIFSGSFDISISSTIPSNSDDILLYKGQNIDALNGNDTVVLNGETLDFSKVKNIETLDLNAGQNSVSNLTLQDVVDMTDNNNTLTITGDSGDSVHIDSSLTQTDHSNGYYTYTHTNSSDPTVTLKIEDDITVS